MRPSPVALATGVVLAFLVATNPVVADAARLITGADVKDESLTGADVKDGSLRATDLRAGDVPTGARGPRGPRGPAGLPGSARAYGVVNVVDGEVVLEPGAVGVTAVEAAPSQSGSSPAFCLQLDDAIDADTAVVVATPNIRTGNLANQDSHVLVSPIDFYCGDSTLPNHVEVVTVDVDSPEASQQYRRSFTFAVL